MQISLIIFVISLDYVIMFGISWEWRDWIGVLLRRVITLFVNFNFSILAEGWSLKFWGILVDIVVLALSLNLPHGINEFECLTNNKKLTEKLKLRWQEWYIQNNSNFSYFFCIFYLFKFSTAWKIQAEREHTEKRRKNYGNFVQ